jgi:hypothetical protein
MAGITLGGVHSLICHPDSHPGAVRSLSARVDRGPGGLLLRVVLEGNLDGLRIPAPRPARIAPRLWERSCCEIFVARAGLPAYHEFNLSPSGEWAAHAFEGYREGAMLDDAALDPRIAVRREAGKLELDALIRIEGERLLIGLAAVLEAADGSLSYWALRHPAGKPDFHHRDAFALEL